MTDASQDEDRGLEEIFDGPLEADDDSPCDGDTAYKVIGCLVRSGLADDEVAKAFVARTDVLDLLPQLVVHCASVIRRQWSAAEERKADRNAGIAPPALPAPTPVGKHRYAQPAPTPQAPNRPKVKPSQMVSVITGAQVAYWQDFARASVKVRGLRDPVRWYDLTVAQHRARAAEIRQSVQSTLATVHRHERAVAECEASGVNTLRELLALSSGGGRAA